MKIPYTIFGNDQLKTQPYLRDGDGIICPHCRDIHHVQYGTNEMGKKTDALMSYNCGKKTYLAGINGKLIIGI